MKISVVIPAYNEADRIQDVILEAREYANEIIVIDDGSTDDTGQAAKSAGAKVHRQANAGYIEAIKRGFQEAEGEIVVTVDADGEFPVSRIPDLVQPILNGEADMVQGSRDHIPRPSERILNWLVNLHVPVGDSGTGFRALRTEFAGNLHIDGACICGILSLEVALLGGRITEIPIQLQNVDKPRSIAWFHAKQFFALAFMLFRSIILDFRFAKK